MADIYQQHEAAFRAIDAYVVLKDGKRVATIAIKYDAAVTAFVHWIGVRMTKGRATGQGYDKASAAIEDAVNKAKPGMDDAVQDPALITNENARHLTDFRFAILAGKESKTWLGNLEDAGFTVLQAV